MDDARREVDAFPLAEPDVDATACHVFDEDVEEAPEHEEHFLDLMIVGGVVLARLHIHHAEREAAGGDNRLVAMLA